VGGGGGHGWVDLGGGEGVVRGWWMGGGLDGGWGMVVASGVS